MTLTQFIKSHCVRNSSARVPLVDFVRAFQTKSDSTRSQIIAELIRAGFDIGQDADKRFHICGLSLAGTWKAVDGALQFRPGKLVTAQQYVEVLRRV